MGLVLKAMEADLKWIPSLTDVSFLLLARTKVTMSDLYIIHEVNIQTIGIISQDIRKITLLLIPLEDKLRRFHLVL